MSAGNSLHQGRIVAPVLSGVGVISVMPWIFSRSGEYPHSVDGLSYR